MDDVAEEVGLHVAWVAVKELKVKYQSPETILFTIYPYSGSLKSVTIIPKPYLL